MISYLAHSDIDFQKWDSCVVASKNGLIYNQSIYLNTMADNKWDAIIWKDYEAALAIPWRRKYGIKYAYQPAFIQQLGIMSAIEIDETLTNEFLSCLTKEIKFLEYPFNHLNQIAGHSLDIQNRKNYILELKNITEPLADFSNSFRKNIKQLQRWNLTYHTETDPSFCIELYADLYLDRITALTKKDIAQFKILCNSYYKNGNLIMRKVMLKNEAVAVVLLLIDDKRIYNILSCITAIGKTLRANYFLYLNLFEEIKGRNLVFDFEGSEIQGVADFYETMHPSLEYYQRVKFNNLPKLIKLLKK